MMSEFRFDESLPTLVRTLRNAVDDHFVASGTALRDASGRLCFVASRAAESEDERERLQVALANALGPYARPGRTIVFADELGASPNLSSTDRVPVAVDGLFCFVIDRRIVGTGWLDFPVSSLAVPPRIAFATLKGGVGRSTALAIAAADLARRDQNVLVVDLDLEAPGVGHMILSEDRLPDFGAVDFLVENGLGGISEIELGGFIGTSALTSAGGGRVDVLPAFGRRSIQFPENVLPKLSRAMIEDITSSGSVSVGEQVSTMIDRIALAGGYDVVLIDSRAGLSELAAPAVIGLGASVLLFGAAQMQTIEGYRALFAGLQLLAQRDRALGRDAEWRAALRPVYAKASGDVSVERRFRDELYDLYSERLYDEEIPDQETEDAFRFARDDETAPHSPLIIPFNPTFVDFDPGRIPGQLAESFYEQTYRRFLSGLETIIHSSAST
jgi:hypothetical protein